MLRLDYAQPRLVKDLPKYGAIGTFGLQGAGLDVNPRSIESDPVHDYKFAAGGLYNLNADSVIKTGGGLSGAHNDIAHPELGHAFWGSGAVDAGLI